MSDLGHFCVFSGDKGDFFRFEALCPGNQEVMPSFLKCIIFTINNQILVHVIYKMAAKTTKKRKQKQEGKKLLKKLRNLTALT